MDTSPLGKARLDYFWLNKGPWSEIDDHKAFLAGVPERKPPGAGFYPADMRKEEFETWARTLSPAAKTQAEGFFTVIQRGPVHGTQDPVRYIGRAWNLKKMPSCMQGHRASFPGNLARTRLSGGGLVPQLTNAVNP